ncbi:unnamed protein product [Cyclocybe aegerita]|uniref:Novel STAND NTPase 1 domain-containing protein n=1 Tax=Cyclocybe aegerita TaxID=1973307 RepID=A0A8S0VUR2_CYCAE|nr:unnamed protein product [Cyclocybe aegerita]
MPKKTKKQEKSSVPTTAKKVFSSSKQVIEVLKSVAGLAPLPYLKDALEVVQRVLQACEDVTTIEQRVKELQDRICDLLFVILDSSTVHKDSKDGVREAAGNMKEDIERLKSNLEQIAQNLKEIKVQKRWQLFVFKDANQSKLDQCFADLTVGLEKFNLSSNLRSSQTLQEIQARLDKMQGVAEDIREGVEELKIVVARLGQLKVQQAENAFKRRPIPLKPRIFYGRDDMVEEIIGWLLVENTNNAPYVCILGPGGMGKTSLALAVANSPLIDAKFHQTRRLWVPCVEATSSNAFLQLLYVNLRTTRDTKDALADILFDLSSSDEPRLILLDNFETPWNLADGSQTEINEILCRLANLCHVALIVTMRGTNPPSEDIEWRMAYVPPTDLKASRLIWSTINSNSKDNPQDVDRLIESLGQMPFAVTLMASLGKESRLPASQLLTEWARAEEREKAFKILDQVDDPLTSIRIVQGLAETHMLLDHDILAMQYANQALSIRQQHFGRTPSMASTFEIMGQIYIRRGEFEDARGAYETVLDLWSGLDIGDPQLDGRINYCKNILQLLAEKEANPDKTIGFPRLSRWAYAPDGLSILLFPRSDEEKIDLEAYTYRRTGS